MGPQKGLDSCVRISNVSGGVISRTKAGQVEGILELAPGVAITFMCEPDGSNWNWLPEEPDFVADESGDYNTAHQAEDI